MFLGQWFRRTHLGELNGDCKSSETNAMHLGMSSLRRVEIEDKCRQRTLGMGKKGGWAARDSLYGGCITHRSVAWVLVFDESVTEGHRNVRKKGGGGPMSFVFVAYFHNEEILASTASYQIAVAGHVAQRAPFAAAQGRDLELLVARVELCPEKFALDVVRRMSTETVRPQPCLRGRQTVEPPLRRHCQA